MIVGIPRETKAGERRVALLPEAVARLAADGHEVRVETQAGAGIDRGDGEYRDAGAAVGGAGDAWSADLVVKVKEIQKRELPRLAGGAAVFSFHHLAHESQRTRELAGRHASLIAFEELRDANGDAPLLAPMSAIAGRMAIDVGARLLGRELVHVLVLGAGHAGASAATAAAARGARVTILTRSTRSRDAMAARGFDAAVATPQAVERHALEADLVVGAVFVPGQPTPTLLPRTLVSRMRRGACIVDISIEEGGVAETSRPTSHAQPTYVEEGVVHYCVGNMPAALPAESSEAISAAALPYVREMAARGVARALREDTALRGALLMWKGRVAHPAIAAAAGLPYTALSELEPT